MMFHGAEYGIGIGRTGNAYAIPTKSGDLKILPLENIKKHVDEFLNHARIYNQHTYRVVAIGCGLAGYKPKQIAPMFAGAPDNVILPKEFVDVLKSDRS